MKQEDFDKLVKRMGTDIIPIKDGLLISDILIGMFFEGSKLNKPVDHLIIQLLDSRFLIVSMVTDNRAKVGLHTNEYWELIPEEWQIALAFYIDELY